MGLFLSPVSTNLVRPEVGDASEVGSRIGLRNEKSPPGDGWLRMLSHLRSFRPLRASSVIGQSNVRQPMGSSCMLP